jgi:two-component system CheB/CheR fusion protein
MNKTSESHKKKKPVVVAEERIDPTEKSFPIVSLGASAGGLEALENFFHAVLEDLGASYVIVSHLDPDHGSILPELIQKKTAMKVNQASDNIRVEPNQVYIIPPNKEMTIFNGKLQLMERPTPRSITLPIDIFLRSLAQDKKEKAIAIILSGTGTDGTLGIRDIKGEGGMVISQDVTSAKYDGMPASAIATGLVDYILPPDKMPAQLLNYISHQFQRNTTASFLDDEKMQAPLNKIFVLLRTATGHDFSLYKKNTIFRRIERRMHIHQLDNLTDYVRYLKESDQESSILFKELLIGVTNFFRDPQTFDSLKKILCNDLKDRESDDPVRIWIAGCSSGEEAYSVGILFQECMEELGKNLSIQIFATDLDEEAINQARTGIYPISIAVDVSKTRLKKYFIKKESTYQVKKIIREKIVFAPQNITKDPPFTKLDLICCRNLLIYFDHELQKKLLPLFHYSLKPEGLLFLGSSESIGQENDLFSVLDKKGKIFRNQTSKKKTIPVLNFSATPKTTSPDKDNPKPSKTNNSIDPLKLLRSIISQSGMPACVVNDGKGNILYIHGRTGNFLEPAEGEANLNLLAMARPGLKIELTRAVRKMAAERQEIVVNGLQVSGMGKNLGVNLIIKPLPDLDTGHRGLMMVFFDYTPPEIEDKDKPLNGKKISETVEIRKVMDELQNTRESLQTTIEELETSNEEQKSTNEELQSTNEELQSTNEELETSKEELQSLNEESATVNSELQGRIDELVTANDDMKNLLDATGIATIFLDINLNIRRFTPPVTELISLTEVDIGRPVNHFATTLKNVDLREYAKEVLKELGKCEVEVQDNRERTFNMSLRPYRTTHNVIAGVVIVFNDITELKRLAQNRRLAVIVRDSNDAVTMHDFAGNILAWNRGAQRLYGYSESEALAMNILDMVPSSKKKRV